MIVGHSLGAVIARLYAGRYPNEVAGMVFVDHASGFFFTPSSSETKVSPAQQSQSPPVPHAGGGVESDPNFRKLSPLDRDLHLWAMAQTRSQLAMQTNLEITGQCIADADAMIKGQPYPFGDKPLVDVSGPVETRKLGTLNLEFAPKREYAVNTEYAELQTRLLSLSKNSKHIIATDSSHFIMIDRPDLVVEAIIQVVRSSRSHSTL